MISIIIPFYSNFSWLEEAIGSIFFQTIDNYEIIVVNDGSQEDDSDFLTRYRYKINYFKISNSGPAYARNFGISKANGDFIAFLDSDDLWYPKKLEKQLSYMINNDCSWSHTGYDLFSNDSGEILKSINVKNFYGNVFLKSLISSPVATPCVMIKKQVFDDNPEFRFAEDMRFGQDGFLWLSLATKYDLGVINETLSKVRIRGSNAALKAKVHLQVKAQIWDSLTDLNHFKSNFYNIPFFVKSAYYFASLNFQLIYFLIKKFKISSSQSEFISKILYTPSFVLLKIQSRISNNVQK